MVFIAIYIIWMTLLTASVMAQSDGPVYTGTYSYDASHMLLKLNYRLSNGHAATVYVRDCTPTAMKIAIKDGVIPAGNTAYVVSNSMERRIDVDTFRRAVATGRIKPKS